jgi:2'-hydroxyisoflavone reductase
MTILVLGGTVFLGRHIVDAAVARGHQVVLFNRGKHNADLFPDLEKLRGDRNGDVSALRGRSFDAVIDTSGYTPAQVRAIVDAPGTGIGHYLFISSLSVYASCPPGVRYAEDAPRADGNEGYGALKARSEDALAAAIPDRLVCVRPGLIVGPHDPTDRFTYWPRRVAQGGRVLAPGRRDRPVQFIDARDLAEWCVQLSERRQTGTFNAIGPEPALTMEQMLTACRAVAQNDAQLVWLPDEELRAAGVSPWSELPLWIPEDDPVYGGMLLADNRRAVAAGLTFRPAEETAKATLDWDASAGAPEPTPIRVTTLTREREAEILARAG